MHMYAYNFYSPTNTMQTIEGSIESVLTIKFVFNLVENV